MYCLVTRLSIFVGRLCDLCASSPAGDTFTAVATLLSNAMSTLQNLLDDIVRRMQQAYSNYVQTETANTKNLTP